MGRMLIFLGRYSKRLKKKIISLDLDADTLLLLCRDEESYLALRETQYSTYFLPDLLSAEDIKKADDSCLDFIKTVFFPDNADKDRFIYKGLRFGYITEHYLIPVFMRVFRDMLLAWKAVEHFEYDRIMVAGPEDFPMAARRVFRERGMAFESWSSGMAARLFYIVGRFLAERKTYWRARPARELIIEPLQNLFVLLDAFVSRCGLHLRPRRKPMFSGELTGWLFFSAEQHTYDVYEKMAEKPAWGCLKCGPFLRMRKTRFGKLSPMESSVSLSMTMRALAAFFHFLKVWFRMSRDESFTGRFQFLETNYWPLTRSLLKYNLFISMPEHYLNYLIAEKSFRAHPRGVLVIGADQPPYARTLVLAARYTGVKSIVIQHGVQAAINGHRDIDADLYAAWGQRTVDWFKTYGKKDATEKVRITGAPRYDYHSIRGHNWNRDGIIESLRLPKGKKLILVLTEWVQDVSISSSWLRDFRMAETVIQAAEELGNGCHIIIKPHPSGNLEQLARLAENKSEKVSLIADHLDELLFAADLCVSSYSTCILEAMFFEKPSIIFDPMGAEELVPYVSMGAAVGARDRYEMVSAMRALLWDSSRRAETIVAQKRFIEYAAYKIDGKSAERVSYLIETVSAESNHNDDGNSERIG